MPKSRKIDKAASPTDERSLSAVFPPCPPLPPGDPGWWTNYFHYRNLVDFMDSIETARAAWRKCPQLVEAKTLDWITPEMWEAFLDEYPDAGYEDHQLCEGFPGGGLFDPDYPARVRKQVEHQLAYSAKVHSAA
jgi:hypothetical protein